MVTHFKQLALSGFIGFVLVAQAVVGLTYHGGTRWPFLSYPMYAEDHNRGDRIDNYSLTAHYRDGRTQVIETGELGLSFWIFRKNYITPIINGETAGLESGAMTLICDIYGTDIDRLEVSDIGVSVGQSGAVYGEPAFVASADVACRE